VYGAEWLIGLGLLGLVAGLGGGFLLANRAGAGGSRARELESQLESARHELESYRQEVVNQFSETARKFQTLNDSYTDLHQQLAKSSSILCGDVSGELLAAPSGHQDLIPAEIRGGREGEKDNAGDVSAPEPSRSATREEEPSALLDKEPSALLDKEPSALLDKEPSALLDKEPSAFLDKEPPVLMDEEPPVLRDEVPSAAPRKPPPAQQPSSGFSDEPSAGTSVEAAATEASLQDGGGQSNDIRVSEPRPGNASATPEPDSQGADEESAKTKPRDPSWEPDRKAAGRA
jgi:uncharacterized membrane-anchored protein YhcB (DUF1043 family)